MNALGENSQFLGIEVQRDRTRGILQITQAGFVKQALERYSMVDCKPRSIPIDSGVNFSRSDEPKCNEQEKKQYREILGIIGSLIWLEKCVDWSGPCFCTFLSQPLLGFSCCSTFAGRSRSSTLHEVYAIQGTRLPP